MNRIVEKVNFPIPKQPNISFLTLFQVLFVYVMYVFNVNSIYYSNH